MTKKASVQDLYKAANALHKRVLALEATNAALVSAVRSLVDRGVLTPVELRQHLEPALRDPFDTLGFSMHEEPIAPTAEDQYEALGAQVWDGKPRNPE